MRLLWDHELVERSVFVAVRGSSLHAAYSEEFAACHERPDAAARERAFRELHETWFDRLGLRGRILGYLEEFPIIPSSVERFTLAEARGRASAGMELYGTPGRFAVLAMMPLRLWLDDGLLAYWNRFELSHIADLLDPQFAAQVGALPPADHLARDRFSVLWACSTDARMERSGRLPAEVRQRRAGEYARAFGGAFGFDELWSNWREHTPTHADLLAMALATATPDRKEALACLP